MKIISKAIPLTDHFFFEENSCFLSIETTGLQPETSALTTIGAVFYKNNTALFKQYFNETGFEQKQILQAFLKDTQNICNIVTYYGTRFCLPFLVQKCKDFSLPNCLGEKNSIDYYQIIHPIRKHLGLSSCKQEKVATFFGYKKMPCLSGKKLVRAYQAFIKKPKEDRLPSLLLNNEEVLSMLLFFTPLIGYEALLQGKIFNCKQSVSQDTNQCFFFFQLKQALLKPLELEINQIHLSIKENQAILSFQIIQDDRIYHYYPNPKDYIYLPLEDKAIYKSFASYIPKKYRQKASADTCYDKISISHPALSKEEGIKQFILDTLNWMFSYPIS